jgi:glyceraldehyde-3-phosphate dehydrogenase (NADP+)
MAERFFLAGRWEGSSQELEVLNPYMGLPSRRVFMAQEGHLEEALEAAQGAGAALAAMASYRRAEVLRRSSQLIEAHREELARLISEDNGKPISQSRAEVQRAALTFQVASEEAVRPPGELLALERNPASEGRWGLLRRFPLGVVLAITPFNFPLNLVAHKVAPAVAAGCPVVLKPSSKAPTVALRLAGLLKEAGLPDGALSVLPMRASLAERALLDARVRVLSFTGSASVGWRLKALAAEKRVLLELGGNAGLYIDQGADLPEAARRLRTGAFSYAGQVCISVQRVYVHQSCWEAFLELFLREVEDIRVGDPLDEATEVGPLVDGEALGRVSAWVQEALQAGARCLAGGRAEGRLYLPTVLTGTTEQMKVVCQEVFGPVVVMEPVEGPEEAFRRINASEFGLQAGVFTPSLSVAWRAFESLQVGAVIINDVPTWRVDHMPYGGTKRSGTAREGVKYAIQELTEPRLLVLRP